MTDDDRAGDASVTHPHAGDGAGSPGFLARQWSAIGDRIRQLRVLRSVAPGHMAATLALLVLELLASGASLIAIGQVVGGIIDVDTSRIVLGAALMMGALLVTPLTAAIVDALTVGIETRLREHRSARLAAALLTPDGIGHLDDGETAREAEELIAASRHFFLLIAGMATVGWLRARITGLAPFLLIAAWHWWAAALLGLVAQIAAIASMGYLRRVLALVTDNDPDVDRRRETAAFAAAAGAATAREVRLFGLLPWIAPRLARHQPGVPLRTQTLSGRRPAHAAAVLVLVAMLAALALIVVEGIRGQVDIARVAVLAPACMALLMNWGPLGDIHIILLESGGLERRMDRFAERLRQGAAGHTAPAASASPTAPAAAAAPPQTEMPADRHQDGSGIDIRHLTFRYPGRESDTLKGVNLTIPAGQSVGIVGANGAGKSTLMSLLAGLEEPTGGMIRIGGQVPHVAAEGEPQVAVILQDFTRYPLDVRDNVLLGRPVRAAGAAGYESSVMGDDGSDAVIRELVDRAGGAGVLERLDRADHGLSTTLSPGYATGTDLSGGQWQRLALARALGAVDAGAEVLILDEPASALDVRVEAELFSDLLALTRGVTTLLVSHRLSSVRRADRIVVVDDGCIVEDGTHDELLAAGGRYATMFMLQAKRFTEAAGEADDA